MLRAALGFSFVAVLLTGCSGPSASVRPTPSPTPIAGEVEGRPSVGMPIRVTGTDTVVVPYTMERQAGIFEDDDPYTKGGYGRAVTAESPYLGGWGLNRVRWHNAVIKSPRQAETIVLPGRGVISRFTEFRLWDADRERWGPSVAYAFLTTTVDGNADGYLNNLDPNELRIASVGSGNLRVVTPPGTQVWNLHFDASGEVLFLQIVRDSNSDGKFDFADEPMYYSVAPLGDAPARPVIEQGTLNELGRRLGR